MDDSHKNKAELVTELQEMRKRITELESNKIGSRKADHKSSTAAGHRGGKQRTAGEVLRESNEKYRILVDNASDMIVRVDAEGRFEYVSPSYCAVFGMTEKELLGKTFMALVHEDDRENTTRQMEALNRPPYVVYLEQRAMTKNGWRWLGWTDTALLDGEGNISSIIGVGNDITDRKQAEESLRASETTHRELLNSLSAGVIVHDADTAILVANPAACKILGLTEQQLRGKESISPDWKFIHEDSRVMPHDEYPVIKVLSSGEPIRDFVVGIKRPGTNEAAWALVNAFPMFDDSDQIQQIIVNFTDITALKRTEAEKLLLERQVQHAQKLESLGVLAGGIAHDFNNLLMSILGNADLALDKLSPMSLAHGNIKAIEKASMRAAELAKQMLAYSGKGRFVTQSIMATELVEEISHLLEVSISKKVVLKYNFAKNVPTFDGDATQIGQIIMNLITNASEAIGAKSGVIALSTGAMICDRAYLDGAEEGLRIGLGESLPEGVYSYFEVADTGCGMDAGTIAKIFDPFFTTKFTGRGLGMSAVLGIVNGHNGALKIYSEVGKGTTFKVLFPANELPNNGDLDGNGVVTNKKFVGSGTVLLIDDEEIICAVGQQMLERMGFNVRTAPDGREGLKMFNKSPEDYVCVICDLTMPHMDGQQTFREMRRVKSDVRVILTSGYCEQDATENFAGKGLAGFIQKPFSLNDLRGKLSEILSE